MFTHLGWRKNSLSSFALILPNRKAKLGECGLLPGMGWLESMKHVRKVAWNKEAITGD